MTDFQRSYNVLLRKFYEVVSFGSVMAAFWMFSSVTGGSQFSLVITIFGAFYGDRVIKMGYSNFINIFVSNIVGNIFLSTVELI